MDEADCRTDLDPLETNGFLAPRPHPEPSWYEPGTLPRFGSIAHTPCQTFRHSGWSNDRVRVLHALKETRQTQQRITSFCSCGSHAYLLKSLDEPAVYRVAGSTCHDRFCVPCATERARRIALNVIERVGNTRTRFVTLTLRQTPIGLSSSIDRLLTSFRKLQKTKLWKSKVTGGIGFMEVKLNSEARMWNVHLHLLCTGHYIPRDELSAAWHKCTGDSFVVHIMLPRGHRHVIKYVTKYASKPLNTSFSSDTEALNEAVAALKGRRLCTTFGGWRGVLVQPEPSSEAWENIGSLDLWLNRAVDGDKEAIALLESLRGSPWEAVNQDFPTNPRPPPQAIDTIVIEQRTLPGIDVRSRTPW